MQKMHDVMPEGLTTLASRGRRRCLLWAAVGPSLAWARAPVRLRIAAASNLKFVLADLTEQYRSQTAVDVEVILGASGNLARQILQGLPVEQFISADEERVAELFKAGRTLDAGHRYAQGRLALVVPRHSTLPLAQGLAAVVRSLRPGDKFAIANPALAPYGLAAQQVLLRTGAGPLGVQQQVWGDNIAQALQFVATGAAQAGLTALALAQAPEMSDRIRFEPMDPRWHAPLYQRMVLLQGASPAAQAWQQYLLGPEARAIFARHGYGLPQ